MIFNHIGIFVNDIELGKTFFNNLLEIRNYSEKIDDEKLGVSVLFLYDKKNICYEIVAPFSKSNPVENVLRSKKNVLNHIAYKTNAFFESIKNLENNGCRLISQPQEALAFNNSKIAFLLTPLNFIIELIED